MQQERRSALNTVFNQNIHSADDLQLLTGYSRSQIYHHLPTLHQHGRIVRKVGSGTTCKLPATLLPVIKQWLEEDPYLSCARISQRLLTDHQLQISKSQVAKRLNKEGIKFRCQGTEPLLTEVHKANRVQWCQQFLNQNFSNIIFTDESYFQLHRNKLKIWSTKRKKVPTPGKSKAIMVFGAISAKGPVLIVTDTGTINSETYCTIICDQLIPAANTLFPQGWILQQDNAPAHTANDTKSIFEDYNINTIPWPARSPDLNIIENCWSYMKSIIERRRPQSLQQLKQFIEETWNSLPGDYIVNLYASLPTRLQKCIESNGDPINY